MKSPKKHDLHVAAEGDMRRPIALPWRRHAGEDCLRDTGIALIGTIPWGTHVCLFCETKQDLLDAASAYFAPACEEKEYCIWVVSPPLSLSEAEAALAASVPDFRARRASGAFEMVSAQDWYFEDGGFDKARVIKAWHARIDHALADGYAGVRACGNPVWRSIAAWADITEYERALERTFADRRIIMLCAYTMENSRAKDVLDVACSHQCVLARRHGKWQFLEVPGAAEAQREIKVLNGDLDVLPAALLRSGLLTERERVVLAQLVRGASSKEAARRLGISPRTVDFHRANMMQKLGARNVAELIGKALAQG